MRSGVRVRDTARRRRSSSEEGEKKVPRRRTARTPRAHAAHTGAGQDRLCVTRCLRPQTSNVLLQSTATEPLYTVGAAHGAVKGLTPPPTNRGDPVPNGPLSLPARLYLLAWDTTKPRITGSTHLHHL